MNYELLVVKAHIPRYRQEKRDKKNAPVIIYETELSANGVVWTIERRYSEFRSLYLELKDQLNDQHAFPPKTLVNNKKPKFLEHRRRDLEAWLSSMLAIAGVLSHATLRKFIALPEERLSPTSPPSALDSSPPSWISTAASQPPHGLPLSPLLSSSLTPSPTQSSLFYASLTTTVIHSIYGFNPHAAKIKQQCHACIVAAGYAADPRPEEPIACVAEAGFNSGFERDLKFAKDELISLVDVDDSTGWWIGEKEGRRGLVPMSCVRLLPVRER